MRMLANLKREERIGLGIAAALHGALVLAFLLQPKNREAIEPADRMTVNLASEVGLQAAAPEPVAESRAAIAPVLSDEPAAPSDPAPAVTPPQPQPTIQPRLERPAAPRQPAPAAAQPNRRPDTPAKTTATKAETARAAPAKPAARPAARPGGSRLGDNFLSGLGDSTKTSETRAPAAAVGRADRASLLQAIVREIKPRWQPPSGPDVDALVSKVRFRLNQDGSLAGRPELVAQRGVNDTNRAQAGRHGEQAIRAVQLAAPFALPAPSYAAWKTVTLDFDWKLAQ